MVVRVSHLSKLVEPADYDWLSFHFQVKQRWSMSLVVKLIGPYATVVPKIPNASTMVTVVGSSASVMIPAETTQVA